MRETSRFQRLDKSLVVSFNDLSRISSCTAEADSGVLSREHGGPASQGEAATGHQVSPLGWQLKECRPGAGNSQTAHQRRRGPDRET